MKSGAVRRAFNIPLMYALVGSTWVLLSDALVNGPTLRMQAQTFKGLAFVFGTSLFLYILVLRRDAALRAAEERARAAEQLQMLGQIAAKVSHDFNNVLMGWRMLLKILETHSGGTVEASKLIVQLQRAERRASHLVSEILAFSSPRGPFRESIRLKECLEQWVSELSQTLGPSVVFAVTVTPPELVLHADGVQMQRLVANLVVNAAEAMGSRGRVTIEARTSSDGKGLRLSVSDEGPGIPSEVAHHVFDPLVTTKRSGTGLGLAIVDRIAKDHGGSVTFESREGRGTTFHVHLPNRSITAEGAGGRKTHRRASGPNQGRRV